MLRYKEDRRTLSLVFIYFAATILAWNYFPEQWVYRILIVISLSILSFLCAITVHNTIHQPIFKSKFLNKVYQVVLSFTYGHAVSAYVAGHNFSHHQHTQESQDRIRTTQLRFKWNFLNQLLFFFMIAPGIVKDENIFAKKMLKEKPNWFRQYVLELVIVVGTKIALVIYNPFLGIMLLVIPHLYAAWGIVGTNFWQHDGCDKDHEYNHSRNFVGGFINYIAFNNGFHGAHHERPELHWSLLPAYHKENIEPHIHPNLNQQNLFTYLWTNLIFPGKRLDYLGNPVVLKEDHYEDWIESADVHKHSNQLGVES